MPDLVDVSPMFPDYDKALAELHGDGQHAVVQLHQGRTYSRVRIDVTKIYHCLGLLRKGGRRPRMDEVGDSFGGPDQ